MRSGGGITVRAKSQDVAKYADRQTTAPGCAQDFPIPRLSSRVGNPIRAPAR